ncbi:hypothetical protein SFPGR_09460 [Sulfuriferula plumbiphila]|nr:hypothetical protein SFPGR_09460 [Sulfuriferula plumbiphila]
MAIQFKQLWHGAQHSILAKRIGYGKTWRAGPAHQARGGHHPNEVAHAWIVDGLQQIRHHVIVPPDWRIIPDLIRNDALPSTPYNAAFAIS